LSNPSPPRLLFSPLTQSVCFVVSDAICHVPGRLTCAVKSRAAGRKGHTHLQRGRVCGVAFSMCAHEVVCLQAMLRGMGHGTQAGRRHRGVGEQRLCDHDVGASSQQKEESAHRHLSLLRPGIGAQGGTEAGQVCRNAVIANIGVAMAR